jgi:hypothetical protein
MNLWHIKRTDECDYDQTWSAVVRAETVEAAREIMAHGKFTLRGSGGFESTYHGLEGPEPWLDAARSTCEELAPEGEPGVIIWDSVNG